MPERSTRKRKPPMPEAHRERALAAKARRSEPWTASGFEIGDEGELDCPFREKDRELWQWLVADALGTRNVSVIQTSLKQLAELCNLNDLGNGPEPYQLNTALAICAAAEPQDEMQAALAMQMVGLHFAAMKLAAVSGRFAFGADERSVATQVRASKAYANLARTLAQLQGKATRHEQHFHYHDERHVHLGGGPDFGGQPHDSKEIEIGSQSSGNSDAGRAALPSPRKVHGLDLSMCSGEGQARLLRPWWGERIWRAMRGG